MFGTFDPIYSTNNLWLDDNMEQCLTEMLESLDTDIAALEESKADVAHTHNLYSDVNHTHTEYSKTGHAHTGYASSSHTHTASDVGALPLIDARGSNYDMDAILQSGVHYASYRINSETLGTPYAKGASTFSYGIIVSMASSTTTGKQIAFVSGSSCTFERRMTSGTIGDWQTSYNSGYKPSLSDLGAAPADHMHNVFGSLTDIGITTFPTTMKKVAEAMPTNSMIIIDSRRVNGVVSDYATETISDFGNTTNGVVIISKAASSARISLQIIYATTNASSTNFVYGNFAYDANRVNWANLNNQLDEKVDKIINQSGVDLNTIIEPGLYYVSSGSTDLHFPAGVNGHMLVMSNGTLIRQVYFRMGIIDSNNFQWYSRSRGGDLTLGEEGWSRWWMISGNEKVFDGTSALNQEIALGSRYGCQSWVFAAQLTSTGTYNTVIVPRQFITTNTTKYRFQIADETAFINFYVYYKSSDDIVYAKVVDYTDNNYAAIKYVFRVS